MNDTAAVFDRVVGALRVRIGTTISNIDHLSSFGHILALMDSEALAWTRGAVGPPDAKLVDMIATGKAKAISFNLSTTRHLVLCMQTFLLVVDGVDRDGRWLEKKAKCDALLSLCTVLARVK